MYYITTIAFCYFTMLTSVMNDDNYQHTDELEKRSSDEFWEFILDNSTTIAVTKKKSTTGSTFIHLDIIQSDPDGI